jgi:hypothetical protein
MKPPIRPPIGRCAVAILAFVLTLGIATVALPQDAEQRALRSRVEERYDVVPLTDGIALTPKSRTGNVRIIEISQGVISMNGTPVSGRELNDRLGNDAQMMMRLSYLTADQRRELFGGPGAKAAERDSSVDRRRAGRERVRIFGDVSVNEDEAVDGQAVAVFGDVRVNGEVRQEAVAVLGSVVLGPKAIVHGDVVSVGGRVRRAEGSRVEGAVTEVSFADTGLRIEPWVGRTIPLFGFGGLDGLPRLLGSTFRMLLLALFAGIVLVIARGSVERSAERVMDNPPKAMLVGLAAELLFLPVLILTAVVLVITLIGIPLLLLLPFAVLMLLVLAFVGFSGTAYALGQGARRRFGMSGQAAFFDVCFGLLIILSPLLAGRVVGLAGWPGNPLAWLLVLSGTAFEFLAWTTGLGAVLINTFSRWRGRRLARAAPVATAS